MTKNQFIIIGPLFPHVTINGNDVYRLEALYRTAGQCEKLCSEQQETVEKNQSISLKYSTLVYEYVHDSLSKRQRRFQLENRQQTIIVKRDGYTNPEENYDSGNN